MDLYEKYKVEVRTNSDPPTVVQSKAAEESMEKDGNEDLCAPMHTSSGSAVAAASTITNPEYANIIAKLAHFKRILCTNFFQIVNIDGEHITVRCKCCNWSGTDTLLLCSNLSRHLRVCTSNFLFVFFQFFYFLSIFCNFSIFF